MDAAFLDSTFCFGFTAAAEEALEAAALEEGTAELTLEETGLEEDEGAGFEDGSCEDTSLIKDDSEEDFSAEERRLESD